MILSTEEMIHRDCIVAIYTHVKRLQKAAKLLKKATALSIHKDISRIRFTSAYYASDLVLDIYKAAINQLEDELDHLYEHEEDLLETFYESTLAEMNKGEAYDGE
jgi:hypothetical protein